MSQQTDELLLHHTMEHEADPTLEQREARSKEIAIAKENLRALTELQKHPGFTIVKNAMLYELKDTQRMMEKDDNPTVLAKHVGEHTAIMGMLSYVENECNRLTALLHSMHEL